MKVYNNPSEHVHIDTDEDVRIVAARSVCVLRCGHLDASGATINGVKIGTPDEAEIELAVRAMDTGRLEMAYWHSDNWNTEQGQWDTDCKTTHCLAGWAHVAHPEYETALEAGLAILPNLSYLFFAPQKIAESHIRRLAAS